MSRAYKTLLRIEAMTNIGDVLLYWIRNARYRVWICTSYIGNALAWTILNKAKQGLDIKIVTSAQQSGEILQILKLASSRSFLDLFKLRKKRIQVKLVDRNALPNLDLYLLDNYAIVMDRGEPVVISQCVEDIKQLEQLILKLLSK